MVFPVGLFLLSGLILYAGFNDIPIADSLGLLLGIKPTKNLGTLSGLDTTPPAPPAGSSTSGGSSGSSSSSGGSGSSPGSPTSSSGSSSGIHGAPGSPSGFNPGPSISQKELNVGLPFVKGTATGAIVGSGIGQTQEQAKTRLFGHPGRGGPGTRNYYPAF